MITCSGETPEADGHGAGRARAALRTDTDAGRQGASSRVNTDSGHRAHTHTKCLVYTWLSRLRISQQIETKGGKKRKVKKTSPIKSEIRPCFVFCWFRGLIRLGFGKIARCSGGYVLEVVQTRNVKMIVSFGCTGDEAEVVN